MLKIIAVRYVNSQIVAVDEFESLSNALGVIEDENAALRSVGYGPEWVVYVVDGQNWFRQENNTYSVTRWDFMRFLHSVGGKYGKFDVKNFEAIDKEDF